MPNLALVVVYCSMSDCYGFVLTSSEGYTSVWWCNADIVRKLPSSVGMVVVIYDWLWVYADIVRRLYFLSGGVMLTLS